MRAKYFLGSSLILAVLFSWGFCSESSAQRFKSNRVQARTSTHQRIGRRTVRRQPVRPISSRKPDSVVFRRGSVKPGTTHSDSDMPRNFVAGDFKWNQPEGLGSEITVTYSYSNLLDGDIQGLTPGQLRQATEEALGLWSSVAPINFVEVEDSGPLPTESELNYSGVGAPQIRIGAHILDGPGGGELAHAFLPFSESDGLAGDLHFDIEEDWSFADGGFFLETILHELGHTLGLEHELGVDAIMNPVIVSRFSGLGDGFLLDDDIAGIQFIYGSGAGSVTPLQQDDEQPQDPEMPDEEDPEATNEITAELDDETGLIRLQGNSTDNSVLVYSSRWFSLVLGFDETKINGKRGEFWMQFGDKSFEIATGEGNDNVYLYGVKADSATTDLAGGDDTLVVIFSRIDSVAADAGEGEDRLLEIFNRLGDLIQSGFETIW